MADADARPIGTNDSASCCVEANGEKVVSESPQETEYASDNCCCNDDEEGGREDMAQMPEGEVMENSGVYDDESVVEVSDEQTFGKVDHDELVSKVDLDELASKVDHDELVSKVDHDELVSKVDHDELVSKLDHDVSVGKVGHDESVCKIDHDETISKGDHDETISKGDDDETICKVDDVQEVGDIDNSDHHNQDDVAVDKMLTSEMNESLGFQEELVSNVYQLEDVEDEVNDKDNNEDHDDGVVENVDKNDDEDYVDVDGKAFESDSVEECELREEGDGAEGYGDENSPITVNAKDKVLDFDEDRRNPQYIPKKGGFYEHDDRLDEEQVPSEVPTVVEDESKFGKKKLWRAEGKWQHDQFEADEQHPKSRDELIATYGYDIRNEDGPPRARRRRRYGRGPMKYTRNWEDEGAYGKPGSQRGDEDSEREREQGTFRSGQRGRGSNRGGSGYRGGRGSNRGRSWSHRDYGGNLPNDRPFDSYRNRDDDDERSMDNRKKTLSETSDVYVSSRRDEYPELSVPGERTTQKGSSRSTPFGGRKPLRNDNSSRISENRNNDNSSSSSNVSKNSPRPIVKENYRTEDELSSGFTKLNIHSDVDDNQHLVTQSRDGRKEAKIAPTQHAGGQMMHERRQATIPPRLQDSVTSRPKRYSSQRQRQAGESVQPEYQQSSGRHHDGDPSTKIPQPFYEPSYQQSVYSESLTNPQHSGSHGGVPSVSTPLMPQHYQGYETPYQETYAIRPMANQQSRGMFNPVSLPAGANQQQHPPAYIPSSGGNMIGYGHHPPPPAYPPPQYHPHPHPHHQQQFTVGQYVSPAPPPPVSQPQEIFSCGMAFYNAPPPVRTFSKRPRAAIPIVPPPEMEDQRRDNSQDCHESSEYGERYSGEETVNVNN